MVCRIRRIAKEYKNLGIRFSMIIENAVENLYMFVGHPRIEPTNNESERMLRKVVIHRKIRQRLATKGGMRMFGGILTCMLT